MLDERVVLIDTQKTSLTYFLEWQLLFSNDSVYNRDNLSAHTVLMIACYWKNRALGCDRGWVKCLDPVPNW